MKKLFEVEVSGYYYVMAENGAKAERKVRSHISRYDLQYDAIENPSSYYGPANDVPIDSDDNRTIGELVGEIRAEEAKRKYLEKHHQELPLSFTSKK